MSSLNRACSSLALVVPGSGVAVPSCLGTVDHYFDISLRVGAYYYVWDCLSRHCLLSPGADFVCLGSVRLTIAVCFWESWLNVSEPRPQTKLNGCMVSPVRESLAPWPLPPMTSFDLPARPKFEVHIDADFTEFNEKWEDSWMTPDALIFWKEPGTQTRERLTIMCSNAQVQTAEMRPWVQGRCYLLLRQRIQNAHSEHP